MRRRRHVQEAFQRMARNLRAAKEREEELLLRDKQSEVIKQEFRRLKVEHQELKAKLTITANDVAQLSRTNHLTVSAKVAAQSKKKEAESVMRAAKVRQTPPQHVCRSLPLQPCAVCVCVCCWSEPHGARGEEL